MKTHVRLGSMNVDLFLEHIDDQVSLKMLTVKTLDQQLTSCRKAVINFVSRFTRCSMQCGQHFKWRHNFFYSELRYYYYFIY